MTKTVWSAAISVVALLALPAHAQTATKPAQQKKPVAAQQAPTSSLAQNRAGVGKGDTEFGLFASYSTLDDADLDQFLIGASIGRFMTDRLEFRIAPQFIYVKAAGTDIYSFNPLFTLEYLFRTNSPVIPFVGGGLGIDLSYINGPSTAFSTGDIFRFGISLAPTAGVKYFLSERTSIELGLSYQLGLASSCDDSTCNDTDTKILQQNIRFNFYY